jgi:hypothetical protein
MRNSLSLAGACLLLSGLAAATPSLAATRIVETTTTTTTNVAPVAPPVIMPPAINSGDSGLGAPDISIGAVAPVIVPQHNETWREYYTGPDGQVHERSVTHSHAP